MLYRSIAVINPLAARLCSSSLAKQQAMARALIAVPATRPAITPDELPGASPNKSSIVNEGNTINAKPIVNSMIADAIIKFYVFMSIIEISDIIHQFIFLTV